MSKPHDCYYGCGFGMKRALAICASADCNFKEIAKRLAFREAERENERYHATEGFIGTGDVQH